MISNQTLKFLLPLVAGNYSSDFYLNDEFYGCFVGDMNKSENDGTILLVYNYPRTIEWTDFELKLRENPNYIKFSDYDYGEKGIVIYRLDTNDIKEDVEKIMNGEYSTISPESKLKIEKFWYDTDIPKKVVNKDESLKNHWTRWNKDPKDYCRGDELWCIPQIEEEIFDLDKV